MPIDFTCPYCGLKTQVADQYAGQSGACAGCGTAITVPRPDGTWVYEAPVRSSKGPLLVLLVVGLGLFALCGGCLTLAWWGSSSTSSGPQGGGRRTQCRGNLQQIAAAMQSYHAECGCFPPAYLADRKGKPMHSWRVLLLPYLNEEELYGQYRFDEPWDGPHNRLLGSKMPPVFRCPADEAEGSDDSEPATQTSYVMITGPGRVSDGASSTSLAKTRGRTILVAETVESGVHWMEPRDLRADSMSFTLNDPLESAISSRHKRGPYVARCDGSIDSLGDDLTAEEVEEMTLTQGKPPAKSTGGAGAKKKGSRQ